MTCFIFAAGGFYGLVERPAPGDLVIAADAGYKNSGYFYRIFQKLEGIPFSDFRDGLTGSDAEPTLSESEDPKQE